MVYRKKYFNQGKILFLRVINVVENQTDCSTPKQVSDVKFLLAEIFKPYEIYRLRDVYKERYFVKKVYKQAKHWFLIMSLSPKRPSVEWKHADSAVKKNFRK